MLDPRQYSGDNEKAEFVTARDNDKNYPAKCQSEADANDAFAALDEIDDGSVYRIHGQALMR
jgi:hypothetical protein